MNNEGYPIYGEEEDPQVAINTRDIAALNQEVGNFQTEINTATQDIDILKGKVDGIEDKLVPDIDKQIADLSTQVATIAEGLRGANAEIGVLSVDVDTAQTDISALGRNVTALSDQVNALSNIADTQFCRVEGIPFLPATPQPSSVVRQVSPFSGLHGDFYKNGYVQTNTTTMFQDNVETQYLYRLRNSETGAAVIGIQWQRRASDGGTVRFRITGSAVFELFPFPVTVCLRVHMLDSLGHPVNTLYLYPVRLPAQNFGTDTLIGQYELDRILELTLNGVQTIEFAISTDTDFGSVSYTKILTGGAMEKYRNYLQVQRMM